MGKRRGWGSRALTALWNRGATEAALLVTAAAVASGVVFGAGVARATSQTSDGQTWISNGNGSIIQINPVTGEPVAEVAIGVDGQVRMEQGGSVVLVTSPTSGQTVSIDVSKVAASQTRVIDPANSKPLLDGDVTYIAEKESGVVRVADTRTMTDIGEAYVAGSPLADVVVDRHNTVWVLGTDASLTPMHYDQDLARFVIDRDPVQVQGVAASSRMVAHDTGVTVLVPSSHYLVQYGTGSDVQVVDPNGLLSGEVNPAAVTPSDLVAATLDSRVLILNGDTLTFVDPDKNTCDQPGRPAVFGERVYVPCDGKGRTVVLDRQGSTAREDIITGTDDDPQIVVDEDSLVVTSSSAEKVVTVDPEGNEHVTEPAQVTVPKRTPTPATTKPKGASSAGGSSKAPTSDQQPTSSEQPSTSEESQVPPTSEEPPWSPSQELPSSPWDTSAEQSSEPEVVTSSEQQPETSTQSEVSTQVTISDRTTTPPNTSVNTTSSATGSTTTVTSSPGAGNDGPRRVRATATAAGVVQVSWTAPRNTPASYQVRTTGGAGGTQVGGSQTSATVTLPQRDGTARFVVIATFADGSSVSSQPSNQVDLRGPRVHGVDGTDCPTDEGCSTGTSTTTGTTDTATTTETSDTATETSDTVTETSDTVTETSDTVTETSDTATQTETSDEITTDPPTTPTTPTTTTVPTTPTTTTVPTTPTTPTTTTVPTTPTTPTTTTVPTTPTTPTTTKTTPTTPTTPTTTTVPTTPTTPTTTSIPPVAPPTPTGLEAYNDGTNGIQVGWNAQAEGTSYTVSYTKGGTTTTEETTSNGSFKQYAQITTGLVTITVVAHRDGLDSPAAQTEVSLYRDLCPQLHAGGWAGQQLPRCDTTDPCPNSPYTCMIPLHNGGWVVGDVVQGETAAPLDNRLGRYGSAAGLLALAGLIRWGRRRQKVTGLHLANHQQPTGEQEDRA